MTDRAGRQMARREENTPPAFGDSTQADTRIAADSVQSSVPTGPHADRSGGGDAVLEAVVFAATEFLNRPDWTSSIDAVLAALGTAAGVSRVYVFENRTDRDGRVRISQRNEWVAAGAAATIDDAALQDLSLADVGLGRWETVLGAGEAIHSRVAELPASEQPLLAAQDIQSIAVVPIMVAGSWWGFIGFDDCAAARNWTAPALAALRAAANTLGAAIGRRRLEKQLEQRTAEVWESEERFHRLVAATVEGVVIHDGQRVLDATPSFAEMLGYGIDDVIGRDPFDFIAPESLALVQQNVRNGNVHAYEAVGLRHDGTRFPVELEASEVSYRGTIVRSVAVRDITDRKRAEANAEQAVFERAARIEAEAAERRAQFLAEASRVLASSFDYQTTLARITRLAVPRLADYCIVDVERDGRLERLATAHADAARESLLREVQRHPPDIRWTDHPIIDALRIGRSRMIAGADGIDVRTLTPNEEHRRLLEQLAPRAAMCVPISGARGVFGVITLVLAESVRSFTDADLAIAEDLASRAALAIQNAQLYQQAQRATRTRDDVLAVVAHDLRNPLNTISIAAQAMAGESGDASRRFVDIVERSTGHMNRLIADLLEVTRLENGMLALDTATHAVGPILDGAATMLRPLAEARRIRFECDTADDLPLARIDTARILQVLSNLGGNAIKFTPEGGRVSIQCTSTDDGDELRFAVADTGPGIPADEVPHLFSRFWQSNGSDGRGVGLGLSIAKGIVDAHGGRIWVECAPGEGSRFYFTVPVAHSTEL